MKPLEFLFDTDRFMTGWHCVDNDLFWGWITIILCFTVLAGYLVIARHWYQNFRKLDRGLPRSSLFNMVNIFLFCGICGYLFIIIMMWWPIWQIRAIFLAILSFFTWRYALNTPQLRVIYEQIHEKGQLTEQLHEQRKVTNDIKLKAKEMSIPVNNLADTVVFGINEETHPKTVEQINKIRSEIEKLTRTLKELEELASKS